ncbi:unnamed protein product [Brachionus calyciflorus]|uniref:Leucine-rich repeat domain-containing protein n=1 Tax=Brachionus calyciflorus TaxID=104777 RepID=A0A813T6K5_9BILA|nr:unnamed protein product [Brachionus calyciflorus]
MNKLEIIEYYDELQRLIDLKCELINFDPFLNDQDKSKINSVRENFINSINRVFNNSINCYKKLPKNAHYDGPFCILIPLQDGKNIGKLIILPKYIDSNIQNAIYVDSEDSLNSKAVLEYLILKQLIKQSLKNECLVDLSIVEKNIIEEFEISFENIETRDLEVIDNYLNIERIKSISLRLKALDIQKLNLLIKKFTSLEDLNLIFYKKNELTYEELEYLKNTNNLNVNLTLDAVKFIDLDQFKQILSLKELKIHESNLRDKFFFNGFDNLKYLSLNWNNLENVLKTQLDGLENLIALDLGGNEIKTIDENIFEALPKLEYLNLRHNYLKKINLTYLNDLKNLEFLSLINGYYDSNDEFYLDIESLELPKLKYLAIRADKIPVLKNLSLEFLEVKGLKELGLENLTHHEQLKGLRLVFNYETSTMPVIDPNVFKSLENLVYLTFRFDYLYDAKLVLENEEFYKSLIKRGNSNFYHNYDEFSYQYCLFMFTVSIFESISDFIKQELNFSKHVKTAAIDYHNFFYKNFFNI